MRGARVRDAPREPPERIRTRRDARIQIVSDLHDEIAAQKEHESGAPVRVRSIQPQVEPEPCPVERGRALRVRSSNDDVVESHHRAGLGRT